MCIRRTAAWGGPAAFLVAASPFFAEASPMFVQTRSTGDLERVTLDIKKGEPIDVDLLMLELPASVQIEQTPDGEIVLQLDESADGESFVLTIDGKPVALTPGASLRVSTDGSASFRFDASSGIDVRTPLEAPAWQTPSDIQDPGDASGSN